MQRTFTKTLFICICLMHLLHSHTIQAKEWTLEKQGKDVSIYSRKNDSKQVEVLVKTTVTAHPHALIHLLDDIAVSTEWIDNCLEVRVLQQNSIYERTVHTFFDAPWPIKNRDMVTYSITNIDDNSVSIKIVDKGHEISEHPKFVRMQNIVGLWRIDINQDKTLSISYQGGGSPAGNIPIWLANKELINTMFNTFQNLRKMIIRDKYQFPQITE